MGWSLKGIVVLCAVAASLVGASSASAVGLLENRQCVLAFSAFGCTVNPKVVANTGVAYSPDGTTVYVASGGSDTSTAPGAVLVFDRDSNNGLTQSSCINAAGGGGCAAAPGLEHPSGVVVSPDGQTVYVSDLGTAAGHGALLTLHRGADGALSETNCLSATTPLPSGCTTDGVLKSPTGLEISPDGTSLYVMLGTFVHGADPGGVLAYSLAGAAPVRTACFGPTGCTGPSIALPTDLALSGGASGHLYVAGGVILRFTRGPDGALIAAGCLGTGTGCTPLPGPGANIAGLSVTPDDHYLYSWDRGEGPGANQPGIRGYDISAAMPTPSACLLGSTFATAVPAGCTKLTDTSLEFLGPLRLSPDGQNLYAAASAGYVLTLRRAPNGSLSEQSCQDEFDNGSAFCIPSSGNGAGLALPSPDGASLVTLDTFYASPSTSGYLGVFLRDEPPTVGATTVRAVTTTSATVVAVVNPHGSSADVSLRYGTTSAYGSDTGASHLGGYLDARAGFDLTGLRPGTTYHYMVTATAGAVSVSSSDATFTTSALPPPPARPRLSRLRISPSRFHVRHRIHHRRVASGATIRYTDSQAARATLTVERLSAGVKRGRRCVAPGRPRRHVHPRRCTRVSVVRSITRSDTAGAQTLRLSSGRGLGPGKYKLLARSANSAGLRSNRLSANFTIVS